MRNSVRSHPLVRAVALAGCVALLTPAAQAGTVETRTSFGRIEMVEEVRTLDPGELPIMHMPNEWTKLHLRWRSLDGVMSVDVVDDGWMMKADITATFGKATCFTYRDHLQYRGLAGESEIPDQVRDAMMSFDENCSELSPKTRAAYARTLADAAQDLAVAEDGMRTRARVLFKRSLVRCVAPPPRSKSERLDPIPMPYGPPPPDCR
jgi:hypothetical protein